MQRDCIYILSVHNGDCKRWSSKASETRINEWIKAYQNLGDEGLMRSRQKKSYSYEYKLGIVEMYLTSELSYMDIALAEKINNPCILAQWVSDFRALGPEVLRPKKKGRRNKVDTSEIQQNKQSVKNASSDISTKHVKELENEILKLRIENAFLKELRMLRLEEEALLKKQQEPSTASEKNLN